MSADARALLSIKHAYLAREHRAGRGVRRQDAGQAVVFLALACRMDRPVLLARDSVLMKHGTETVFKVHLALESGERMLHALQILYALQEEAHACLLPVQVMKNAMMIMRALLIRAVLLERRMHNASTKHFLVLLVIHVLPDNVSALVRMNALEQE